jgi:hypothetical protein
MEVSNGFVVCDNAPGQLPPGSVGKDCSFDKITDGGLDQGVDIVTISRRLGHAKPDITLRIYAHLFRKDDSKAAAAINAILK